MSPASQAGAASSAPATPATPSSGAPETAEGPAPEAWTRFEQAVTQNDAAAAAQALRDLPPQSSYGVKARDRFQQLFRWFAALHLQKAEAARQAGECVRVQDEVQQVLELAPLHREALAARWRHCGVTFFGAPPRDPYRVLGYPPLRPFLGAESTARVAASRPAPPTPVTDDDQALREAQLAHAERRFGRAIDLAHGVIGGDPQNASMAWRLIAVSACGQRRAELAGAAYDRLDPTSRAFVRVQCERAGMTGFR